MPRLGLPLFPSPFRWTLVGGIATVIFANSIVLAPPVPPGDFGPFWDKKLHFAAYAALTASLAYATVQSNLTPRTRILTVLALAAGYGIAIELLQLPLPDRYFSLADLAANALGALLGLTYLAVEARVPYVRLDWLS
jgi:VanZ family protein